jgi:cell division protein FtsB
MKQDEGLNLDVTGNEQYRRELIAVQQENEILKKNINDLQGQLQSTYHRIKVLIRDLENMKRIVDFNGVE